MTLDHYATRCGIRYNEETKMFNVDKPHHGRISDWSKGYDNWSKGYDNIIFNGKELYYIKGKFMDHPRFGGNKGWTSLVLKHDEETGEIETMNSRYTLVGEENNG